MGARTSVPQYYETPAPCDGKKEGPTKPWSGRRAQEAWLGEIQMPQNTEWVGGVCPTKLNGWGNDILQYWVGGGMAPDDSG